MTIPAEGSSILQQIFKTNLPTELEKGFEFPKAENETSVAILEISDALVMYQQNSSMPFVFGSLHFRSNVENNATPFEKWILLKASINGWQSILFYPTKCILSASAMGKYFEYGKT